MKRKRVAVGINNDIKFDDNDIITSEYGYKFRELVFESWKDIRNYLVLWDDEIRGHSDEIFLFRGHSSSSWELKPTLERIKPDLENGEFSEEYYLVLCLIQTSI